MGGGWQRANGRSNKEENLTMHLSLHFRMWKREYLWEGIEEALLNFISLKDRSVKY